MVLEEGNYRALASPIKLSRTPASLRRLPPAFGQHNDDVAKSLGLPAGPSKD
jgi:crotonobetainyl-CoA:carnitine CoA-transferase CaiB-like acyl-CoA transferase